MQGAGLLVLLVTLLVLGFCKAQNQTDYCTFTALQNYYYDVRSLAKEGGHLVNDTSVTQLYVFNVNFCKPVNVQCSNKGSFFKVIQTVPQTKDCYYLAAPANVNDIKMELLDPENPFLGVALLYTQGEKSYEGMARTTRIRVFCAKDWKKAPKMRFIGEVLSELSHIYEFEIDAPQGCPMYKPNANNRRN